MTTAQLPRFAAFVAGLVAATSLTRAAPPPKGTEAIRSSVPRYDAPQRTIVVDGDSADWRGVPAARVAGPEHLWFGQGMVRENWRGDADLSYSWRACWSENRLCFLFEVRDDRVAPAAQASSYLCDCVEIYLDMQRRGGRRVEVLDGRDDWFARCDPKELRGWELHFLPTEPPRVYLDHRDRYDYAKPHTDEFVRQWAGQIAARRTPDGYRIELGFAPPGATLRPGQPIGVEIGVCDDDGAGRKSILMWTGAKADFWLDMTGYGTLSLQSESAEAKAKQSHETQRRARRRRVR